MKRPSLWQSAPARPSPAQVASALALALALPACSSSTADDGTRKCYSQIPAVSPSSDGKECGARSTISVEVCERLPQARCTSTTPSRVCVATPGDKGFIVELSPCADLESLPQGWALASTYITGIDAAKDCAIARNLCDGTNVTYDGAPTSPSQGGQGGSSAQAGSGGSGGSAETAGSSGASGAGGSAGSSG